MDNNFNNEYLTYSNKPKKESSFIKSSVVPFISSAIGTFLIIGICFGIPGIKNKILSTSDNQGTTENSHISSIQEGGVTNTISLTDYSNTSISVAEKVMPSIVGIKVQYNVNTVFGQTGNASASGSGIIISEDGYILTNNHIVNSSSTSSYYEVAEATKVTVTLYNDETEYDATIVGTDSQTDLAVIKIEKTGLTAAELGDSDSVKVGEFAMAIGNPLGLQSSITCGIISAVNREVTESGNTYILLQTDAAINSGNSGGALVNADGKVIGINTLKLSGTGIEGIGFAIPINSTVDIYEQLIQYNKVKRPYIGIGGRDIDEKTAQRYNLVVGVYVQSIDDFSAAQKAGLKIGDVIISADGKSVKTMDELNEIKNSHNIGDKIKLKINRSGSEMDIELTLQEQ